MSNINNESILETIFDELSEEFPSLSQEQLETLTYEKFEAMC